MGQALRMMSYDQAANERNALAVLRLGHSTLQWFRLDDGVMGGRSESHHLINEQGHLVFQGLINTNGGGFTSIRAVINTQDDLPWVVGTSTVANITPTPSAATATAHATTDDPNIPKNPNHLLTADPASHSTSTSTSTCPSGSIAGVRLRLRGDGKTYKFFLSDGSRGGPFARAPSWQADVPTVDNGQFQDRVISFHTLLPSFGGGKNYDPQDLLQRYHFHWNEMKELGIMLSLKLANGEPNPKETFGEGIFPFMLEIASIDFISDSQ